MDALLEKLNSTSPERAQQQLDSLRNALVVRLSALESALADGTRGDALEGLILELARIATEEAQAAALKVCLDTKVEADGLIARARTVAQEAIDKERTGSAELRQVVDQARQRMASLEQDQAAKSQALRKEFEAEIARERSKAAGLERAIADAQQQLQAELAVSADLRATIERTGGDAARQVQAERTAIGEVRQALERAEREKAQAWTAQEALTANLVRERETAAALQRAKADMQAQLEAERGVSADLRRAAAQAERQLSEIASGQQQLSASQSELQQQLNAARADADERRGEAEAARAETLAARSHAETARAQIEGIQAEMNSARAETDAAQAEAEAARNEARETREESNRLRAEADDARAQAEAMRAEHETAKADAESARAEAEALKADADAVRAEAEGARANLVAAGGRLEMLDAERLRADQTRKDVDAQLEALARERDLLAVELQEARHVSADAVTPVLLDDPLAPPPAAPPAEASPATQERAAAPGPAGGWGPIRLAVRHAFQEPVEVQINGHVGVLVDLSVAGCQLVSTSAVKPNQVVKVLLPASGAPIACTGKVMWARFEPRAAGRSLGYRAGVQFTKPDQPALEAFLASRPTVKAAFS